MAIAAGTGHSVAAITPARRVAVRLLRDQRVRDGRSRELLRSSDALSALDERDRALATRLVLGVVASRGALDAAIDSHLRPHSHLEPKVRDALRLASFELMYLDTPPSAAVSQGVELVRLASRRAAALANAVLRRVAERDAPSAAAARARVVADDCSLEDLALTAALPIWLVRALVASRGESLARRSRSRLRCGQRRPRGRHGHAGPAVRRRPWAAADGPACVLRARPPLWPRPFGPGGRRARRSGGPRLPTRRADRGTRPRGVPARGGAGPCHQDHPPAGRSPARGSVGRHRLGRT